MVLISQRSEVMRAR